MQFNNVLLYELKYFNTSMGHLIQIIILRLFNKCDIACDNESIL